MKRWSIYVGTTALLVGLPAVAIGLAFQPPVRSGIWAGLSVAWLVQAVAFAILLAAARRRAQLIVAGWTAGTLLRLGALGAVAWLCLGGRVAVPAEPTLLALVSSLFALLLMEPVVFRLEFRTR
ncbi:MAG: hypothetical protein JSU87_17075 [Gemmatimonadota bacterium]|nr:MAG: hypothetical protein JSU87_17075 [Gemmatimonadota bacterium]